MSNEVANKRGRKPIVINKNEFQNVVAQLERGREYPNRTILWQEVSATDWAKNCVPRPLTPQVAMVKAEELGIEIKTPKGTRGRMKGQKPVSAGGRKKKFFSTSDLEHSIPKEERSGLQKTIQKAGSGSLKARVKLMCLDCCNWQKGEIAECQVRGCPLFDVRPYKRMKTEKEICFSEDTGETFVVENRIPLEVL